MHYRPLTGLPRTVLAAHMVFGFMHFVRKVGVGGPEGAHAHARHRNSKLDACKSNLALGSVQGQ